MKLSHSLVLLLVTACGGGAASSPDRPTGGAAAPLADRSFVLVHGAWMGAWSWDRVTPELQARGAEVIVVELPGHGGDATGAGETSLAGYVDAVGAAIASAAHPVVLVGHSMGGVVITQAAEARPPALDRIIYVAGYVPKTGETLQQIAGHDATSHVGPVLKIDPSRGVAAIPAEALVDVFCADCPADAQAQLATQYRDEPLPAFAAPVNVSATGWGAVPRFYLFTARDHAVSPELQREMTGSTTWSGTATLDTGHAPMLSAPRELAEALATFALAPIER